MQTYPAGPITIWHVDLYRLSDAGELLELGLDEAFDAAVVFVEWPERLGAETPSRHLALRLDTPTASAETRVLHVDALGSGWDAALSALAGAADAA